MNVSLGFFAAICVIICVCHFPQIKSAYQYELLNLECESQDESLIKFNDCKIKAVNRSLKYITIVGTAYRLPIKEIQGNLKLMYKANGWKPFLYDTTFNVCKEFAKHSNPLSKLFFSVIRGHTNFPLRCPINVSPVRFENITNLHISQMFKQLPFATGEYALFTTWLINGKSIFTIKYFAHIKEA